MSRLRERFDDPVGDDMRAFSSSLDVDLGMLDEDIAGSVAHAVMLGETGILDPAESRALVDGLAAVRDDIRSGAWAPDAAHEDIHMAVEARLSETLGELGRKLHVARSRNDQVATDVRLWMRTRIDRIEAALVRLIAVLLDRIEADGRIVMPGYTHLQRGQPIVLGHHLLAHAWALARDVERMRSARERVDRCPLGAGAMAGTSHPIDRARTAELLGFAAVVDNAMDAVAARDHLQETVAACAIACGHLSRMAEELVLWSSAEFAFARPGDAYATGSSIMPQKRNPDAAELVRGKAARVHGDLTTLLALTRALPLAYNRDLQEDREPLFHAVGTTLACVDIMTGMWRTVAFVADRFESVLRGDFALATEIADFLATRGVPFRDAHGVAAKMVHACERRGIGLDGLSSEEMAAFHPALAEAPADLFDPRAAVDRRTSLGGTAWVEVERQVRALRSALPRDSDAP